MAWKTPVVDRTQADVDFARENPGSTNSLKGARNISDLRRVKENLEYLSEALNGYGYMVSLKDMPISEIPKCSDILNLIENTRRIRSVIAVYNSTPTVPNMPINTYQKMNDLEKILFDVEALVTNMPQEFIYCGEIDAGEDDWV